MRKGVLSWLVLFHMLALGGLLNGQTGSGAGAHDPTLIKVGDTYVRFATGRGVSLALSHDMRQWDNAGSVFTSNPEWTRSEIVGSTDFWAPDVIFRDGEWRLYYSVSTFGSNRSAIGMAVNANLDPSRPNEGWIDKGPVFQSYRTDNFNAIDPQIAHDKVADQDWLVFGSFWSGIKMVPLLSEGTIDPQGERIDLAQRQEASGSVEGAFLHPHDGKFYLFASFDFCCKGLQSTYNIRVGRSDTFAGPYLDRDGVPMLEGGGTIVKARSGTDIGPGHNSIFVDGGREYLVYHTYDVKFGGAPRLRIQELTWDAEGWPVP